MADDECPTCGAGRNEETDDLYRRLEEAEREAADDEREIREMKHEAVAQLLEVARVALNQAAADHQNLRDAFTLKAAASRARRALAALSTSPQPSGGDHLRRVAAVLDVIGPGSDARIPPQPSTKKGPTS